METATLFPSQFHQTDRDWYCWWFHLTAYAVKALANTQNAGHLLYDCKLSYAA